MTDPIEPAVPGLRVERDGEVAVLTLTDAARLNPLTEAVQRGLLCELRRAEQDPAVRALLLTGEGRGFCVGADLSAISHPGEGSVGDRVSDLMRGVSNPLVLALQRTRLPLVVAANGACAGAGVSLALAADVLLMAHSAYLYLPFAPRLGLVPDLGSTWLLPRAAGRARALGMALLDERIDAQRAVAWGLAWDTADGAALRGAALDAARRLARLPSHAALEMREAFARAGTTTLAQQLAYEADRQRVLLDLPSFDEGVRAFLEKRAPSFAASPAAQIVVSDEPMREPRP